MPPDSRFTRLRSAGESAHDSGTPASFAASRNVFRPSSVARSTRPFGAGPVLARELSPCAPRALRKSPLGAEYPLRDGLPPDVGRPVLHAELARCRVGR